MEVHHHSHGHTNKNWKSYIWEFAMLFLAVFCGSVAEYYLEHKIEKDKEKQYISSLIDDLKVDTINIASTLADFNSRDSSFSTIDAQIINLNKTYNPSLIFALKKIMGYKDFIPTDKTLQQLKNAGTLRLIQKKGVTDSIANYDLSIKRFQITSVELTTQFYKVFDDYQSLIYLEYKDSIDIKTKFLLNNDDAAIKKYHNHILLYKLLRKIYVIRLKELRESNISLLALLKKEYHLN